MSSPFVPRRSFLSRIVAGAAAMGAGSSLSAFVVAPRGSASPESELDGWLTGIRGPQKVLYDCTSAGGAPDGILFARNFLKFSQDKLGTKDSDMGVIVSFRHFATPYAYNDAIWAKYGKAMPPMVVMDDPKTKQRPDFNLYGRDGYDDLPSLGTTIPEVEKKGVHFAVCQLATRFFSTIVAKATGGNADAVYNELVANLIPNSHMVAAGIVAVNRAQEHGFTLATAI